MTSLKIKKGDEYWCIHPRVIRGGNPPLKGKIIVLSTGTSKQVGLEFAEDIGGHTCDGRGENGKCLWVSVSDLATDNMAEKLKEDATRLKKDILERDGVEVEEFEVEV